MQGVCLFPGPLRGPLALLGAFPASVASPLVSTLRVRGYAASRRSGPRLQPWAYADRPVREVPGPGGGACAALPSLSVALPLPSGFLVCRVGHYADFTLVLL